MPTLVPGVCRESIRGGAERLIKVVNEIMSSGLDPLIKDTRRRQDVFRNLNKYLRIIKEIVKSIDPNAEVCLFGSVTEGECALSSNVDVLVIINVDPGIILKSFGVPILAHHPRSMLGLPIS